MMEEEGLDEERKSRMQQWARVAKDARYTRCSSSSSFFSFFCLFFLCLSFILALSVFLVRVNDGLKLFFLSLFQPPFFLSEYVSPLSLLFILPPVFIVARFPGGCAKDSERDFSRCTPGVYTPEETLLLPSPFLSIHQTSVG